MWLLISFEPRLDGAEGDDEAGCGLSKRRVKQVLRDVGVSAHLLLHPHPPLLQLIPFCCWIPRDVLHREVVAALQRLDERQDRDRVELGTDADGVELGVRRVGVSEELLGGPT